MLAECWSSNFSYLNKFESQARLRVKFIRILTPQILIGERKEEWKKGKENASFWTKKAIANVKADEKKDESEKMKYNKTVVNNV